MEAQLSRMSLGWPRRAAQTAFDGSDRELALIRDVSAQHCPAGAASGNASGSELDAPPRSVSCAWGSGVEGWGRGKGSARGGELMALMFAPATIRFVGVALSQEVKAL